MTTVSTIMLLVLSTYIQNSTIDTASNTRQAPVGDLSLEVSSDTLASNLFSNTCANTVATSFEVLSPDTYNEYLDHGGIHNTLEKMTSAITLLLDDTTQTKGSSARFSYSFNELPRQKEKINILGTLFTLLDESINIDCALSSYIELSQLSHVQESRLQQASQWLKSESINSRSMNVTNADTLLALSMSSESGLHFIIMNIDPFSKQTLPLSFFNAGSFVNPLTQERIDGKNNPVLKPADFMLLTFRTNTQPK
jgi:hypothetical protein